MDANKINHLRRRNKEDTEEITFLDIRKEDAEEMTLIDEAAKKVPTSGGIVWARGDVINNLYRVEEILRGGMGVIYFIEHLKWGIKLVVKSPLEKFLAPEHKLRFIREAETWVDLGKHSNIITAFYVREVGGIPCIFIEFADGGSLADWLKEGKLKDFSKILDISIQFCEGIIHAHSYGLVHRDIKPDNVLMMKDGTAKITDFGLVKTKDKMFSEKGLGDLKRPHTIGPQEWKTIFQEGFAGSPPYTAPEQWKKAAKADKRSDIYSFGVMLYEMVCGRRPFIKEQDNPYPVKVAYQLMHTLETPPDPVQFRNDIPLKLKNLIVRCMEKDPGKRYKDFEEIKNELILIYKNITGKNFERARIGELELRTGDLNNKALSYIDLGKKQEARTLLEEAIKLDPNSLAANINLIILLTDEYLDTYENILLRFKTIREGNPSSPLPYHYEAIFELERGNPYNSLLLINKALEMEKRNALFWNFKGIVLHNIKKYSEALKAFEEALKIDGSKREYIRNYAISLYYSVKYEKSSREFSKLLNMFPEDRDIKMDLAVALTGKKEFHKAEELFQEVLETDPQSVKANLYLAEFLAGIDIFVPTFFRNSADENAKAVFNHLKKVFSTGSFFPRASDILKECVYKFSHLFSEEFIPPVSEKVKRELLDLSVGNIKNLKGYGGRIEGISFFSSGKKAVSCNSDGVFEIWDLQGCEVIRKFSDKDTRYAALDVTISPCDSYIVSAHTDRTLKIWDASSGECINTFYGHENIVRSVHFSSDGKFILSAGADATVRVWDAEGGECLRTFNHYNGIVFCARFSPDGRYIAAGSQIKDIYICNTEKGDIYKKLCGHTAPVLSIAFSPDGRYLLSGSEDRTLKLWDIEKEECVKTFTGHSSQTGCVHFSPHMCHVASGSEDGSIKIWDIESGNCVRTILLHNSAVLDIKFSPHGRYLLSAGKDGTLKYIHIPRDSDKIYPDVYQREYLIVMPRTVEQSYKDVEIFQKLLSQAEKHLKEEKYEIAMKGFRKALEVPGYIRDDRALAGIHKAGIGGIRRSVANIWLSRTYAPPEGICAFDISDDGSLILYAGKDNNLYLVVFQNTKTIRTFSGHTSAVFYVKISHNRLFVISGDNDRNIKFWEIKNAICRQNIQQPVQSDSMSLFPCNNYIATGGGMSIDTTIKIWDMRKGEAVKRFEGHRRPVTAICVFDNGLKMISGSADNTMKLWDLESGRCTGDFCEHELRINHLSVSPDGNFFVSASDDKTLKLWNIDNNKSLLTLTGHEEKVNSSDFSPDGNFIVSGSSDKTLRLWCKETGICLRIIKGHNSEVTDVKFSPDCRYIFSSDSEGLMKIWELDWDWVFDGKEQTRIPQPVTSLEKKNHFECNEETMFTGYTGGTVEKILGTEKVTLSAFSRSGETISGEIESWVTHEKETPIPESETEPGVNPVKTHQDKKVDIVKVKEDIKEDIVKVKEKLNPHLSYFSELVLLLKGVTWALIPAKGKVFLKDCYHKIFPGKKRDGEDE